MKLAYLMLAVGGVLLGLFAGYWALRAWRDLEYALYSEESIYAQQMIVLLFIAWASFAGAALFAERRQRLDRAESSSK